jgi:hypothetical protein
LEHFVAIVRFAGLPAFLIGIAIALPGFSSNLGSDTFTKVAAKSALIVIAMSFLTLLIGTVIYQLRNTLFPASGAFVSASLFALPVALAFLIWVGTGIKPSVEAAVLGVVVLLVAWALYTLFAFVVTFLFPRMIGILTFCR